MQISGMDHLVLTVANTESTCAFYEKCGFERKSFGSGRIALHFGKQKINLHEIGREFEPKAQSPTAGSIDICFVLETPLTEAIALLQAQDIEILEGPLKRTGAQGSMTSIYIRDPDGNLLEFSSYSFDD